MAFANTFVTLDDVSITNLGDQSGNILVVADDGLSITGLSNSTLMGAGITFKGEVDEVPSGSGPVTTTANVTFTPSLADAVIFGGNVGIPVPAPVGFNMAIPAEFDIKRIDREYFLVDYDCRAHAGVAITTPAMYVDSALGNDSNDGLSTATPKKTLSAAQALTPSEIYIKYGSVFQKNQRAADLNWDVEVKAYGNSSQELPRITARVDNQLSAWTLSGNHYVATVGDFAGMARDRSRPDGNDGLVPMTKLTSITDVNNTPNSWYLDWAGNDGPAQTVYMRTFDDRAPDSDIELHDNLTLRSNGDNFTVYMNNIWIDKMYQNRGGGGGGLRIFLDDCRGGFSPHGVDTWVMNGGKAWTYGEDAINIDDSNGLPTNAYEIRVNATNHGDVAAGATNDQASTTHNNSNVIRLGGTYYNTDGQVIADVQAGGETWMAGCSLSDSQTGVGAYFENEAYIERCTFDVSGNDLQIPGTGNVKHLDNLPNPLTTDITGGSYVAYTRVDPAPPEPNSFYAYDGNDWVSGGSLQGDQGATGFVGSRGSTGFTGSQGTAGAAGATGFTGSAGSQGQQGLQGFTGSIGTQGTTGFTGSQGDQGATGFTGSEGAQGAQGNVGFTGSASTAPGPQGNIGYTGSQGAGFTGSQGIQGNVGYTGSEGTSGYTGSIAYGFTVMRNEQDPANVILADQFNDVLTFSGGNGIELSFNTGTDTITISNSGTTGFTGSQGDIGFTGSVGFAGSAGPNGFTGSQGDRGYTGSTGDKGNIGFSGSAGIQGFNGSRGFAGSAGFNGSVGFTGSAGFNGSRGFTGNTGVTGFTGSQGLQGNIGFTGSKGNVGITGYAGSRGITGFNGSRGFQGFVGSQGDTGYGGSQGVIGFTGSKGDQGDPGYIGSSGFQGSAGFQGSQGFVGSVGLQGYAGSRGFSGSRGTQGLLGPQGPIGYTGSQGLRGYTGSAQPAWRTFRVVNGARQENVVADQEQDVLDLIAGPGITLTTDADLDSITINADTAANILADISVVQNIPTGDTSTLVYNNSGIFTFTSASADDIVAAANIDLSNYYTKSETYSKAETDAAIADATANANLDLSNYYTKPETNVLLDAKMTQFSVTNGSTLFSVTNNETVNLIGTSNQIVNTIDPGLQQVQWSLAPELELNNVSVNGVFESDEIISTGNVLIEGQNTVITGNLTVLGNTTTINSNVIETGDTIITLNADLPGNLPPSENLGLKGNRGNEANVFLIWDENLDYWTVQSEAFHAREFIGNVDISANSIVDLNDVTVNGLDDGEILVWDAGNATWTNSASDISSIDGRLTALEGNVTTLQTNVTVLQGNVVSIENELANIADTDAQTLTWDTGNADLSISNGNTVDLGTLYQDLTLNTTSNVLTISDGNSVDFTPILGGGGGGGGSSTVERFRIDYDGSGVITGISGATSGISSTSVDDAVGGIITFDLDTNVYSYPFAQITYFGYDAVSDRYVVTPLMSSIVSTRFLDGDGGNVFDGTPNNLTMTLLADKAVTFASGTSGLPQGPTHAYVVMTCTTV